MCLFVDVLIKVSLEATAVFCSKMLTNNLIIFSKDRESWYFLDGQRVITAHRRGIWRLNCNLRSFIKLYDISIFFAFSHHVNEKINRIKGPIQLASLFHANDSIESSSSLKMKIERVCVWWWLCTVCVCVCVCKSKDKNG